MMKSGKFMVAAAVVAALCVGAMAFVGLRYYFDKTQSEIAKELGISQVQVSRLENKILENFRSKLS